MTECHVHKCIRWAKHSIEDGRYPEAIAHLEEAQHFLTMGHANCDKCRELPRGVLAAT